MPRALVAAFLVIVAACGGEASDVVFEGTVVTDVELGLTVDHRLAIDFTPGVWTAERDGDVVTLHESHLVGDEGGINRYLELDFSHDPPRVIRGFVEFYDAYAEDRITPVQNGVVEFQHADPSGVIAGQWIGETDATMTFWVDLSDDTYAEIEVGQPFELRPGGYATWTDSTVFHYREVTEDSRCPPDVTCVWEGRVEVVGTVWDIEDQSTIRLEGIRTPTGPAYGSRPSDRFRNNLAIVLIGLDESGLATFVVERSG